MDHELRLAVVVAHAGGRRDALHRDELPGRVDPENIVLHPPPRVRRLTAAVIDSEVYVSSGSSTLADRAARQATTGRRP